MLVSSVRSTGIGRLAGVEELLDVPGERVEEPCPGRRGQVEETADRLRPVLQAAGKAEVGDGSIRFRTAPRVPSAYSTRIAGGLRTFSRIGPTLALGQRPIGSSTSGQLMRPLVAGLPDGVALQAGDRFDAGFAAAGAAPACTAALPGRGTGRSRPRPRSKPNVQTAFARTAIPAAARPAAPARSPAATSRPSAESRASLPWRPSRRPFGGRRRGAYRRRPARSGRVFWKTSTISWK